MSKKIVSKLNNQQKALELFTQGYSYREIAHELDVSLSNAYGIVQEGLDVLRNDTLEEVLDVRNVQLNALKKLIKHRFDDLQQCDDVFGDDGRLFRNGVRERGYIVRDILSLYQEIGKIFGIYAPEKIEQLINNKQNEANKALEADYANMSTDELQLLFADLVREQG